MFWILGADAVGSALRGLRGGRLTRLAAEQMEHSPWAGFRFYDLIFPLFIFMAGVSIAFAFARAAGGEGRRAALGRVARRGLALYGLGLLYYGGFAGGFEHIRLLGVLQRIALCYVSTAGLFLAGSVRAIAAAVAAILVGYWALLAWVPVPGFGAGDFAEGHNLANWIDARWLPLLKWNGNHDPEGLLSTLPAIASCLLGLLAGLALRSPLTPARKAICLAAGGLGCICAGLLWGVEFPVIKKIWTSSFVLVAGGWSLLLLAAFYYVIDVRGWTRWAQPFIWIGTNALAIYLLCRLVDFKLMSARLFGGEIARALDRLWPGLAGVWLAATGMVLCVLVCRLLYVKKIFLRL